jgi:alpha-mannosidase
LFAYPIEISGNAMTLKLPDNDKVRILAISVVEEDPKLTPVTPLFDTLDRRSGSGYAKAD